MPQGSRTRPRLAVGQWRLRHQKGLIKIEGWPRIKTFPFGMLKQDVRRAVVSTLSAAHASTDQTASNGFPPCSGPMGTDAARETVVGGTVPQAEGPSAQPQGSAQSKKFMKTRRTGSTPAPALWVKPWRVRRCMREEPSPRQ